MAEGAAFKAMICVHGPGKRLLAFVRHCWELLARGRKPVEMQGLAKNHHLDQLRALHQVVCPGLAPGPSTRLLHSSKHTTHMNLLPPQLPPKS